MKIGVSLQEEDVEFLDQYAEGHALRSRSAAIQQAIGMLRTDDLKAAYASAFAEWDDSGEAEVWGSTAGDGL